MEENEPGYSDDMVYGSKIGCLLGVTFSCHPLPVELGLNSNINQLEV